MVKNNQSIQINFLIAVIAAILFVPFLGQVHLFDWDEINFAESAREMILTGDYLNVQINFKPFYEKPPLFIWMQVLSMKVFGINEFAARFPNAVCGIITLLILFNIGRSLINKKFGIIWTITYAGSLLPFLYFKSGIIDPWFNLFIFTGIYFLFRYLEYDLNKKWNICISALFIGLAVLTKGPVGFLLFGLTGLIFLIYNRFQYKIRFSEILLFTLVFIFTGGLWFILQIANGNFHIIQQFITYQVRLFQSEGAGHGGFLMYHFVVILIGVFPASIFILKAFKKNSFALQIQNRFKLLMSILFWIVLILFTIVKTKIVHYSSMCYFPLTFLASTVIFRILEQKERFSQWLVVLVSSIG
ncbi:MAG: glycosyltransferase family 39 protein, partial [Bacteroidales bacterium]|nr:glycosyltransferase family 39 protein [Bacteroidales bacterium]